MLLFAAWAVSLLTKAKGANSSMSPSGLPTSLGFISVYIQTGAMAPSLQIPEGPKKIRVTRVIRGRHTNRLHGLTAQKSIARPSAAPPWVYDDSESPRPTGAKVFLTTPHSPNISITVRYHHERRNVSFRVCGLRLSEVQRAGRLLSHVSTF